MKDTFENAARWRRGIRLGSATSKGQRPTSAERRALRNQAYTSPSVPRAISIEDLLRIAYLHSKAPTIIVGGGHSTRSWVRIDGVMFDLNDHDDRWALLEMAQ